MTQHKKGSFSITPKKLSPQAIRRFLQRRQRRQRRDVYYAIKSSVSKTSLALVSFVSAVNVVHDNVSASGLFDQKVWSGGPVPGNVVSLIAVLHQLILFNDAGV